MASIEESMQSVDSDWGGIEQLTPTMRIGYAQNVVFIEKTLDDGQVGVYNLPHIPSDKVPAFLAWLASL